MINIAVFERGSSLPMLKTARLHTHPQVLIIELRVDYPLIEFICPSTYANA
jgi:hypothetical protein